MPKKKIKAKKKPKKLSENGAIWGVGAWWSRHPVLARNGLVAAVTVVSVFAVALCLTRLEAHVHELPRYEKRRLAITWTNLPSWLRLPENHHILRKLEQDADLGGHDRILDHALAERVCRSLSNPRIGWIRDIHRVIVRPNGEVAVDCDFRRPLAWVESKRFCYLVDESCVRLPGRYEPDECLQSSLLMVSGISEPVPSVGQTWHGADLQSGLRVAAMIAGRPFRDQVDRIIVTNHDGRVNRNRPQIEIATTRPGSRIWWGLPPGEEYGTETTAHQKIALLERLYREFGRIDQNRPYVDIRSHPQSVAVPRVHEMLVHQ